MTRLLTRPKQISVVLLIVFLSQAPIAAVQQQRAPGRLVEEFSFLIKDFRIDHQGETNVLNITIRYQYRQRITESEYPDFRLIAKDVENFLANYPNENDYWEILNKKITLLVLNKYPTIARVTSDVQVSPSPNVPYQRSSIVTRERSR